MVARWWRVRGLIDWHRSLVEVAALGALGVVLSLGSTRPWRLGFRVSAGAIVGLGFAAAALILVFVPRHGLLVAIAVCAAAGASWLAQRRAERARARATSLAVQAVCADLADDLRMGRVPEEAIATAGTRWPPLRPAVMAAHLQDDVGAALREIARLPGAEGLRDVAAAWQISGRAGSGLSEALDQVTRLLAARERRARLIDAELAAARATAAVVSGLPLLVLAMGAGLGTNPWSFFLKGIGAAVLGLAGMLLFLGWAWLDRLAVRAAAL